MGLTIRDRRIFPKMLDQIKIVQAFKLISSRRKLRSLHNRYRFNRFQIRDVATIIIRNINTLTHRTMNHLHTR